ncbi:MAG: polysaccharide biosynthesis protein, partial [Gemmatimonadetes bacterium]|nr:polysaccharide biosynthesis protein [Gemmatimonadota bacterium]
MHSRRLRGMGVGARLARGGVGTFVVAAIGAVLALLLQMLITHFLGATRFGDYAYALSIVNLLAMIAVLGFEGASLRFVATYRGLNDWAFLRGFVSRSFQFSLLLSVIVAGGFAVFVGTSARDSGNLRLVL